MRAVILDLTQQKGFFMRGKIAIVSGLALALTAGQAIAHHSYASFDQERTVDVTGTVKQFQWRNPHIVVVLTVVDPRTRRSADWTFEGPSPNGLRRAGWSGTMMKAGDRATVKINPMRNGAPGGALVGVTVGGRRYLKED